jgi:hypothetical protein
VAVKKRRAEQFLERHQRLGHRRLRDADGVRRALHAAQLGQLQHDLQVTELAARKQPVDECGGGD